jgi:squalene-hopene/tetraprenyl-beta-curcumene cyclase
MSRLFRASRVQIVAILAALTPALTLIAEPGKGAAPQPAQAATKSTLAPMNPAMREQAEAMAAKAAKYLRKQQDQSTGGWSMPKPDKDGKVRPQLPGITALALVAIADDPKGNLSDDQNVSMAVKYLLNLQQPDGGIYDKMLPSYNTALSVSALSKVGTPDAKAAAQKGVAFLRQLQWSEDSNPDAGGSEAPKKIDREHPFYGGIGYGRSGRPDNSNLNMFMQALQDAGVSPDDEAVKRALVFLQRTQMDDRVNSMPFAKGSRQGGFIYSTVPNADSVDSRPGESHAGKIEETLSDGTKASMLRCYGSMTYAGFKTYLYAQLPKDDSRVTAAWDWIRRNYSVEENPAMGTDGLYYYYVVFARALKATGNTTIETLGADGKPDGGNHAWREELVERLASLQNEDGSFKSVDDRWMESNPELITAYSLIALRQVLN